MPKSSWSRHFPKRQQKIQTRLAFRSLTILTIQQLKSGVLTYSSTITVPISHIVLGNSDFYQADLQYSPILPALDPKCNQDSLLLHSIGKETKQRCSLQLHLCPFPSLWTCWLWKTGMQLSPSTASLRDGDSYEHKSSQSKRQPSLVLLVPTEVIWSETRTQPAYEIL